MHNGHAPQLLNYTITRDIINDGLNHYTLAYAIAWNKHETNLFAAGYEQSQTKNESSLLIWDITKSKNPNLNRLNTVDAIFDQDGLIDPTSSVVAKIEQKQGAELIFEPRHAFSKINEDVYSLCWFPESSKELLYGTYTNVKMCDIREYQGHFKNQYEDVNKGQVNYIKFDPFNNKRFGVLTDESIKIYDVRTLKRPVIVINDPTQASGHDKIYTDLYYSEYQAQAEQYEASIYDETRKPLLGSLTRF